MVRRTAILGVVALVVTAGQAFAATTWHTQMKDGSATASRSSSKCAVAAGAVDGSLRVTCKGSARAKLRYVFSTSQPIMGTPSASVDTVATGSADATSRVNVNGKSLRVTVVVTGSGSVQINSVSAGYYTG